MPSALCAALALSLALALPCAAADGGAGPHPETWAPLLGTALGHAAGSTVTSPAFLAQVQTSPAYVSPVDFQSNLDALLGNLRSALLQKAELVVRLRAAAEALLSGYSPDVQFADEYVYPNVAKPATWPNLTHSDEFGVPINLNTSMVLVPLTLYDESNLVQNQLRATHALDEAFRAVHSELPDGTLQYLAGSSGVLRIYPAFRWTSTVLPSYTPISFTWMRKSAAGRKNIVIIIDASGSNDGYPVSLSKQGAKLILDTLEPEDYVNVIYIQDEAANVGCFGTLVPAVADNVKYLKNQIDAITVGQKGNFASALHLGLDHLENAEAEGPNPGCVQAMLIFSDGVDGCSEELLQERNSNRRVRIFTYRTGRGGPSGDGALKCLACQNRGVFEIVENINALESVYTDYLIHHLSSDQNPTTVEPVWSPFFADTHFGPQIRMAISLPVYTPAPSSTFFGVVAVEITLASVIKDMLQVNSAIGQQNYVFVVNDKGSTVFHPFQVLNEDFPPMPILTWEPALAGPVLRDMMGGGSGTADLWAMFYTGDEQHTTPRNVSATYTYKPLVLPGVTWSICVVVLRVTSYNMYFATPSNASVYLHNIDIYDKFASNFTAAGVAVGLGSPIEVVNGNTCKTLKGSVVTVSSSAANLCGKVSLPSTCKIPAENITAGDYESLLALTEELNRNVSLASLTAETDFGCNGTNSTFFLSTKLTAQFSSLLDDVWISSFPGSNFSYFAFGSIDDVIRMYPGEAVTEGISLNEQTWYKTGLYADTDAILSLPFTNHKNDSVAGIGKRVFREHNGVNVTLGVVSGFMTIDVFQNWTLSHIEGCASSTSCYILDRDGNVFTSSLFAPESPVFFGETDGELAQYLVDSEILEKVTSIDGQFICENLPPDYSSAFSALHDVRMPSLLAVLTHATRTLSSWALLYASILSSLVSDRLAEAQEVQSTRRFVPCSLNVKTFRIPADLELSEGDFNHTCMTGSYRLESIPGTNAWLLATFNVTQLCSTRTKLSFATERRETALCSTPAATSNTSDVPASPCLPLRSTTPVKCSGSTARASVLLALGLLSLAYLFSPW